MTNKNLNKQAIGFIKSSIKNDIESYRDFLAGGVYILVNNELNRDSLADIVKKAVASNGQKWEEVKRVHNRRITQALTLAESRFGVLADKTPEEIRQYIIENGISSRYLDGLKDINKNQKTEKQDKPKNPEKQNKPESVALTVEEIDEVNEAILILDGLTAKQKESIKKHYESKGYFFTLELITKKAEKVA